jgi:hypothetical protein
MPEDMIFFNAMVAEKILMEHDGISSAIRLVDLVFVDPSIPPEERPPFPISLLIIGRFKPGHNRDCVVKIQLIRTNGDVTLIAEQEIKHRDGTHPDAPTGFNVQAQFAIVPKNLGTCYVSVSVEDAVVKIPITFLEGPKPQSVLPSE